MSTYAIDFESTYEKGERDISSLGVYPYLRHIDTDIYLVSIVGPGVEYCGTPLDAPWDRIHGHHWVSHNAAFDHACFDVLQEQGYVHSEIAPSGWDCTANLAAYLGAGRSLLKASATLLGVTVDKATRDKMAGKTWANMTPEFRAEAIAYALNDSVLCLRLWEEHAHRWPEWQRELSRHTLLMCRRGIGINALLVETNIDKLKVLVWEAQQKIPWAGTLDEKGKEIGITSTKALRLACEKAGIPPPATTNAKSDAFDLWSEKYADQAPFVQAIVDYRSLKRTLDVLEKFNTQSRDGRLSYSLKYFGAHTGRFSGDSGLNFQNFTKKEVGGVNLRHCLIPGPGKKFIVADLKQIEARVALWVAGDTKQLDLVRGGMCIYEAHARTTMGYKEPMKFADWVKLPNCPFPKMRDFAKCRRLGLQFGLGPVKFIVIAKEWAGLVINQSQSKETVSDFRKKEWRIVDMWTTLENALKAHAGRPEPFTIELPSGRELHYFNVRRAVDPLFKREVTLVQYEPGGPDVSTWGGTLFENCVAGDMEVYTERRGWIPLNDVSRGDLIWDGHEFVAHGGLVHRGYKPVVNCHGVLATPDHRFLTLSGWVEAQEIVKENLYVVSDTTPLEPCGPAGEDLRVAHSGREARIGREEYPMESSVLLRKLDHTGHEGPKAIGELRESMPEQTQEVHQAREVPSSGLRGLELNAAEVQGAATPSVSQLRSTGYHGLRRLGGFVRGILGRYGFGLGQGSGDRPDRQQPGVLKGELSLDNSEGKRPQQANEYSPGLGSGCCEGERGKTDDVVLSGSPQLDPGEGLRDVYDIINCGPRHKFVVRAPGSDRRLIAHNCVQAIAADVLAEGILRIEGAGYPVVLHVHDEAVVEVPMDTPIDVIEALLTQTPTWAEGLPIGADSHECTRYEKP